jgi:hypothetical protein
MKTIDDVYIQSFKIVAKRFKSELDKVGIGVGVSSSHILERAKQRHISVDSWFDAVNYIFKNKLCELAYAMSIGKKSTIEIRYKGIIVVLARTFRSEANTWIFATVLDSAIHSLNKSKTNIDDVYRIDLT